MLRTILVSAFAATMAGTAFGQSQPDLKAEAQKLVSNWEEYMTKGDAKAVREIEASKGVVVNPYGLIKAGSETDQLVEQLGKSGVKIEPTITDAEALAGGNAAVAVGSYEGSYKSGAQVKGNILEVIEKEGSVWKIRALSLVRQTGAPPSPTK
jgi:ketosteroid isomerase-like protein